MATTAKDLIKGIKGMSESDVMEKCEAWLKGIESNDFELVPTFSAFADYIRQPRADVHEWIRLHPVVGKSMRDMVADTLAAGAMKKAYESRIATFALKNWCGWDEQPAKTASKSKEVADEKKAASKLQEYMASERRNGLKVVG